MAKVIVVNELDYNKIKMDDKTLLRDHIVASLNIPELNTSLERKNLLEKPLDMADVRHRTGVMSPFHIKDDVGGLQVFFPLSGMVSFDPDYSSKRAWAGTPSARISHETNRLLSVLLDVNKLGEITPQPGFGRLSLRVEINPDALDFNKSDILDTEQIRKIREASAKFDLTAWNPLLKRETLERLYKVNMDNAYVQFDFKKMDLSQFYETAFDPINKSPNGSHIQDRGLTDIRLVVSETNVETEKQNLRTQNANVNQERFTNAILIPRLTNEHPRINSTMVYKSIAEYALGRNEHTNTNKGFIERFAQRAANIPIEFSSRVKDEAAAGITTKMYNPFANLLFSMVSTSDNTGYFMWEAPDDHPFLKGTLRVPYVYANTIDVHDFFKPTPSVAFLPAKFATQRKLNRILPVNKAAQETITNKMIELNTDEVRQAIFKAAITDKGFTENGEAIPFSDAKFDRYLDAPKAALPYVYNGTDTRLDGAYRPAVTTTQVRDLTEWNTRNSYNNKPSPIILALPYQGDEMPTGNIGDNGRWVGYGHVIPFEIVYIDKPTASLSSWHKNSLTQRTTDNGLDYSVFHVGGFGYGRRKETPHNFVGTNAPHLMSMRFDIDSIYTPVAPNAFVYINDHLQVYNKAALPSPHLTGLEESEVMNAHMLVPPRVLNNEGNPSVTRFWPRREKTGFLYTANGKTKAGFIEEEPILKPIQDEGIVIVLNQVHLAGFDDATEKYLRPDTWFAQRSASGKYMIADAAVSTNEKVDTFFSNRIISATLLDRIRGGSHFTNSVMLHASMETVLEGKSTRELTRFMASSGTLPRYKTHFGIDYLLGMGETNLAREVPYLRDYRPLEAKDDRDYLSSDGLSLIVRPADYSYVAAKSSGVEQWHMDGDAILKTAPRKYDETATPPHQDPAVTHSWLDNDMMFMADNSFSTTSVANMTALDTFNYMPWGTADSPVNFRARDYRHIKGGKDLVSPRKGGNAISTTGSYFLSMIFNRDKYGAYVPADFWMQYFNKKFSNVEGWAGSRGLYVSSLVWFNETLVGDAMAVGSNQYGGIPMTNLVNEKQKRIDYNYHETQPSYNYLPTRRNFKFGLGHVLDWGLNKRQTTSSVIWADQNEVKDNFTLSHTFNNLYPSNPNFFREELLPGESTTAFELYQNKYETYSHSLDISEGANYPYNPSTDTNANAFNVMAYLPTYFEKTDPHAYDVFATRTWKRSEKNAWDTSTSGIGYDIGYNNANFNATNSTKYNTFRVPIDVTRNLELAAGIVTGTKFVAARLVEPFDMIIPTTILPDSSSYDPEDHDDDYEPVDEDEVSIHVLDWRDPENWKMVEGYEENNTYALMDHISIDLRTVEVGQEKVRCYPVTVPMMYRKPKQYMDISTRWTIPNPHTSSQSDRLMTWMDVLANGKPFLYTFHVVDIAYLLKVVQDSNQMTEGFTYVDKDNTMYWTTKEVGRISSEDANEVRRTIAAAIGLSPVLLEVFNDGDDIIVSYTDKNVGMGIPFAAGSIRVSLGPVREQRKVVTSNGIVQGILRSNRDLTDMTPEEVATLRGEIDAKIEANKPKAGSGSTSSYPTYNPYIGMYEYNGLTGYDPTELMQRWNAMNSGYGYIPIDNGSPVRDEE